jgi:hypothetical protein
MMGYVIVGHCPKCGAPIYAQQVSMSISPPKSIPSCRCATKEAKRNHAQRSNVLPAR